MSLQREQIDLLLDEIEATARRRHRANPDDPHLARDIVAQTRALLRDVDLQHHVHICDHAQHLLLTMVGWHDDTPAGTPREGVIQHAVRLQGPVPDMGIPLLSNPFDVDAYSEPPEEDAAAQRESEPVSAAEQAARDERRAQAAANAIELRSGLSRQQLATLDTMAHFGWKLEFVRRPLFQPPIPVAFDRNGDRFVVIAEDGTAAEDPSVKVRN